MAQAAQRLGQRLAARGPQLLSGETGRERGGTEGTGRDWGGPGENWGGGREPSLTPPVLPRPPPSCRGVLQASPGHVLVLRQGGAGAADPRRDPQGHRQHEGAGQELPDRPPGADHRQGNPPGVSGPYQAIPSPYQPHPRPRPDRAAPGAVRVPSQAALGLGSPSRALAHPGVSPRGRLCRCLLATGVSECDL